MTNATQRPPTEEIRFSLNDCRVTKRALQLYLLAPDASNVERGVAEALIAEMDELMPYLARRADLQLKEFCAQALGEAWEQKRSAEIELEIKMKEALRKELGGLAP